MDSKVLWLFILIVPSVVYSRRVYLRPAEGGTSNVYSLINSVWGNGATSENPDCSHPTFGRHIFQGNDGTLNKQVIHSDFWNEVVLLNTFSARFSFLCPTSILTTTDAEILIASAMKFDPMKVI